jgi:DNA replication protein DnaC
MTEHSSYCAKHKREKDEVEKPFGTGFFYHCPECGEEQEAEVKEQEEKRIAQENQEKINRMLRNAMLAPRFKDKTFDNYKAESEDQKKAVRTARWFLDNLDNTTGLILIGNPGTGKNHLASAIITEAIKNHNKTALFMETLKIVRAIKESWRRDGETESKVMEGFVLSDILVVDEIGVQFGSETERMYLTEIINDRYNHLKPTILIGNVDVEGLSKIIGDRPLDRFREGGKLIMFGWESYRKNVGS